jgi:hypothetical protein
MRIARESLKESEQAQSQLRARVGASRPRIVKTPTAHVPDRSMFLCSLGGMAGCHLCQVSALEDQILRMSQEGEKAREEHLEALEKLKEMGACEGREEWERQGQWLIQALVVLSVWVQRIGVAWA